MASWTGRKGRGRPFVKSKIFRVAQTRKRQQQFRTAGRVTGQGMTIFIFQHCSPLRVQVKKGKGETIGGNGATTDWDLFHKGEGGGAVDQLEDEEYAVGPS